MFYVATNSKGRAITFENTDLKTVTALLMREFSDYADFEIEEFESEEAYYHTLACRDGFWG